MIPRRVYRLLIAIYSIHVIVSTQCVNLVLESAEIAHGKPIIASSTCEANEMYCFTKDDADLDCNVCDGNNRIETVTSSQSSPQYWQSAVLSNRSADERVDITIDLKQKYRINQVSISTAFTPQPSVWVIEASRDGGKQYSILTYFVSRSEQCSNVFGFNRSAIAKDLCIVQQPVKNGSSEKVDVSYDGNNAIADHLRLRLIQIWQSKNQQSLEELSRFYTLKKISVQGIEMSKDLDTSVRTKRQSPCYCSRHGTMRYLCNVDSRYCPCRTEYAGKRCNKCARGYFNYPACLPCECSRQGSEASSTCKRNDGQCRCKPFITGRRCDRCLRGYHGFPSCQWCSCHLRHTTDKGCDLHGKCLCKENYDGRTCGECKLGYVDYPTCRKLACTCPSAGSQSIKCNADGQCDCKEGYKGPQCDSCRAGYYGYPECRECTCDSKGSLSPNCDSVSGRCACYPYVAGRHCDRCESGYFGFPRCQQCICDPDGKARNERRGNSICASGREKFQCRCKTNVAGATCDKCKDLYYNFSPRNPQGCRSCGCFKGATIGGLESCDENSGQCACKPFTEGRNCYECKRGYHSLDSSDIFGCQACKCNPGGSYYSNCDKRDGKCQCRANIGGTNCDRLRGSVYYPSLHHIAAEVEDGKTADRKPVKYGFDSNIFPSYSWRGYVNFSPEETTVILTINIPRRSLYRIFFRCIFEPIGSPTTTDVSFTVSPGEGVSGFTRIVTMTVSSTRNVNRERSSLLTVSQNDAVQEFLMFAGEWSVTVDCESKYMLMDYLVFMPEEYYTGRILKTIRVDPCVVDGPRDTICDRYSYPEVSDEHAVKHEAENGYFAREAWGTDNRLELKYYSSNTVLKQLSGTQLVLMNNEQNRFAIDMNIPKSGDYVFAVHFISHGENSEKIDLYVHRELGSIHIFPCKYQFGCRQVAMKPGVKTVKRFDLEKGRTPLNLFTSREASIAVDYISAIPYELWHPDYITPALVCRSLQDECISSSYAQPTTFEQHPMIARSVDPSTGSSTNDERDTLVRFRSFFNKKTDNFVVIIQYQQTKDIVVNGRVSITTYTTTLEGVAEFKYCPNTEFCRIVVKPTGNEGNFRIRQGTTLIEVRFPANLSVKVSWLYRIPSTSYSDNVLSFTPIDNSNTWVEQCSLNNFVIDPRDPSYCRNTSFSLVTNFNNGALPCRCSYPGSSSRYCNQVHGKCTCRRPNIIGRQCTQCRSGYYGFPYCRRCTCDPRGVDATSCDNRGRCKCKPNFSGISCNRCKSSNYDFPTCAACDCDNHGSLSQFCSSTSGQCQCRRGYAGRKCDRCRVGFFGFPDCKECNCHVSGIKPIEGLLSGCNSSLAVKCECKDNVNGKYCDTCKDFYYNLQFNDPNGCQRCTCSDLGTNSQLKICNKVSGQCSCKSRVNEKDCSRCKDGSTFLRAYNIFGCKGCECNYGGSIDNICDKQNGACSCKRNISGTKCDSVKSDGFYVQDLHHIRAEFEDGRIDSNRPLRIRHSQSEFPGFSGKGYVPVLSEQSSFDIIVEIPRPTKYRLLIRYILDSLNDVFGQVTISPTGEVDPLPGGYDSVQVASVIYSPTSTRTETFSEFLTVKRGGKEAEFFLSRGKWRISLFGSPSKLLLDYLVMIPEDYYKATYLRQRVEKPCLVGSTAEYCVDYKYLTVGSADAVTIAAELGVFAGSRALLPYAPFKRSSVLSVNSQLTLPLPVQKLGSYVLMATYYQEVKTVSDILLSVRSGHKYLNSRMRTFYCKYTFGCRQVAIDEQNKVVAFEFFPNIISKLTISPLSTVVAVESITIIPYEEWNIEYILPSEHCVKSSTGCIPTTYQIHRNAIKVEAEKRGQGMKPSLAIDASVRAAYLVGDGVSLRVKSRIQASSYNLLVHYYQPSHGKYNGRIIVESGGRSTALYLKFNHCPNVGGCRVIARDKITETSRSLYITGDVDITISITQNNEVWIDYILFVPSRHFTRDMEKQQPVSLAQKFVAECGQNNFVIDSSSEFCKRSVFTMTTMFNGGLSACDCDRRGSTSVVCDKFGGQCPCRRNVVGRKCDKCVAGYTGFPNCRRS